MWLYMKLSNKCHFSYCRLSGAWIGVYAYLPPCMVKDKYFIELLNVNLVW